MKLFLPFILASIIYHLILADENFAQNYKNKAADFNGINSYISIPDNPELNPLSSITIEAWIYPRSYDNFPSICGKRWVQSYWMGLNDQGQIRFNPKGGMSQYINGNGIIPLNTWTHIAGTYDGTNIIIYINGNIDKIEISSGAIGVNTDSLYIGADRNGNMRDYFFNGMVDNFRIWSSAKTQNEIRRDMFIPLEFQNHPGNPSGLYNTLALSYIFDNGAIDNSGSENNSGVMYLVNLINQFTSNYNDYNNSLILDGNSYCTLADNSDFSPSSAVTIEAWIKWDSTSLNTPILNIINKSRADYITYAAYLVNRNLVFSLNNESKTSIAINAVPPFIWTHIACSYNASSGESKIYINGNLTVSTNFIAEAIATTSDTLYIGKSGFTGSVLNNFRGQIDNIGIWKDVERTGEQIKQWIFKGSGRYNNETGYSSVSFDDFDNRYYDSNAFSGPVYFHGNVQIGSPLLRENNTTSPPVLLDFGDITFFPEAYKSSFNKLSIPENTFVYDSIYVSETQLISGLEIFTLINHSFPGDLRLAVIAPDSTTVNLLPVSNNGTDIGNDIITIFDLNAENEINTNGTGINAPFSPTIRPAESYTVFYGKSMQGWWKLRLLDVLSGETGYLNGWGIHFAGTVPVEFLSFTAKAEDNNVILNWSTATETNNIGFDIERSNEGENKSGQWGTLGFVKGNGTSTRINKYTFIDRNVSGSYSYRIKQKDYDGSYSFSDEVSVSLNAAEKFSLEQNFPNPFNPFTIIKYNIPEQEFVQLKIYDLLGKEIAIHVNKQQPAGSYTFELNSGGLSSGIYFYELKAGENVSRMKMIVVK